MRKISAIIASLLAIAASGESIPADLSSPDGNITVRFNLTQKGQPIYSVRYKGQPIINRSHMGFILKDGSQFTEGFSLTGIETCSQDTTWVPVWGENAEIRDNYNGMTVSLSQYPESGGHEMGIEFRAYNDGAAFRYIFPECNGKFTIKKEITQMAMTGNHTAWWIPGDYDTQEYEYTRSRLSEIRRLSSKDKMGNIAQRGFSPTGVQTSLMLKTDSGIYLNLHEAALVNFPAMHLDLNDTTMVFTSELTPDRNGDRGVITAPFRTPWRVAMMSDKATDILASDLIYNLNEPCVIKDTSWITPVKYMGVWWEMITGKSSWSYCDAHDFDLATFDYTKTVPHGRHGANNDNVRKYIDFAAANGMDQLLIEGWNTGWEDWFGKQKEYVFDFITPYPDFDIEALNDYAHSKGIRLMMHHETSGSIPNYESHIDRAYDLMNKYGYNTVKSGYVGKLLPDGETHYSQWAVNHYLECVKKAADKHIMVNGHEAVRPTGLARTYPNLIGNESAMGTEYQSMSPTHVTILPFTRLKGGPMDFTPGIFKMDFGSFAPGNTEHKRATVANQLALYLTMYSPLQMAADMPEHYAEKMDAFQFIKDVPVDWSESRYIDAEPGEFIIVARKDKNSRNWFAGGVTGANGRETTLRLDFLATGKTYMATIYADAPDAHYETNPEAYTITRQSVTCDDTIPITMVPGGGFAISFQEL